VQAEDVLRRMRARGVAPDAVSYASIAEAMTAADRTDQLEALISTIDEEEVVPDIVLLNALLNGCAKSLRWQLAVRLLSSWTAKGVPADHTSYAHALRACVKARVPAQATEVVRQMKLAGLQPDVRIYSMLLSAYAKSGKLRTSLTILQQMRSEGIRPSGHVYAGLMEACLLAARPETAIELFEQMRGQGVAADTVSYTLLIRATMMPRDSKTAGRTAGKTAGKATGKTAGKKQRPAEAAAGEAAGEGAEGGAEAVVDAALAILAEMETVGGRASPNTLTYNEVMEGCLARGQHQMALQVVTRMLDARLPPNRRTSEVLAALTSTSGGPYASPARRGILPPREVSRPSPRASPSPGAQTPAATLAFLRRVIDLFGARRQRLGGDVYLAAMAAARRLGDPHAAREIVEARVERRAFHMRREHEVQAEAAEEELRAGWGREKLAVRD